PWPVATFRAMVAWIHESSRENPHSCAIACSRARKSAAKPAATTAIPAARSAGGNGRGGSAWVWERGAEWPRARGAVSLRRFTSSRPGLASRARSGRALQLRVQERERPAPGVPRRRGSIASPGVRLVRERVARAGIDLEIHPLPRFAERPLEIADLLG